MSLLAVLPLWLVYEGLRFSLAPGDRNGAEALITESLLLLGPHAVRVLKIVLALCVLVAGVRVLRGDLPWLSVSGVAALEGAVYGLMLGPVTQALTFFVLEGRALGVGLRADLIGSLGAGLFEEAVFRLGLAGARRVVVPEPLFHYRVAAGGMLMSVAHQRHGKLWRTIQQKHPRDYSLAGFLGHMRAWSGKPARCANPRLPYAAA